MKVRHPYSLEFVDVPEEDILHVPSRPMFVPSRNDFYMQAALQGLCANPLYARETFEMIANMAMDQASALVKAIDQFNCGELDEYHPGSGYDSLI